jgi:glycosyltransferase involved in cell wall biosynthesis
MKILYVLDFFYPHVGGVPTLFYHLAKGMVQRGHQVTVITAKAEGAKRYEVREGIRIHRVGRKREQFMTRALLKLISRNDRYDIIHTSTYSAMIPSFFFSFFRNIPKVLSAHEVWTLREWKEFTKRKGLFYFLEERLLFKLPFDAYIVPSLHTKRDLEAIGVKREKIQVVPHGIDTNVFNPSAKKFRKSFRAEHMLSNEVVGAFIGKATTFKGINYLLDSLEIVMKKKKIKMLFMLSKSHASGYRAFVDRISSSPSLREGCIVVHPVSNPSYVAKLIASSDFVVMPSLTEGFGFAAAEAAAVGVPVIVTKGTSLEEIIEHGKHGLHVRPRSSKELSQAILRVAGDRSLLRKLGRGKSFSSWKKVVKHYETIYEHTARAGK